MLSGTALFCDFQKRKKARDIMATTDTWQQFKALIPEGARVAITTTVNDGNGSSQAELQDGSVITVKQESMGIGKKAFIQDGEVK